MSEKKSLFWYSLFLIFLVAFGFGALAQASVPKASLSISNSTTLKPYSGAAAAALATEPIVKVRFERSESKIKLSGMALRIKGMSSSFKNDLAIQSLEFSYDSGAKRFLVVNQLGQIKIINQKSIEIEGDGLVTYRHTLPQKIIINETKNGLDLIGFVPLENYILGVVASEVPKQWPLEVLKTQAVASRSYVLSLMKERSKQSFHVENSILDQVFVLTKDGYKKSDYENVRLAVQGTKGQFLVGENHKVLKAFFHSDCGGKTIASKEVWGTKEISSGVICPNTRTTQWEYKTDLGSLSRKLSSYFKLPSSQTIKRLSLVRPSQKDRVVDLSVAFAEGQNPLTSNRLATRMLSAQDLRRVIGYSEIKSTMFEILQTAEGIIFKGKGYGHGVGLCQSGANFMAKAGKNYQQILAYYYQGTSLSHFTW